MTTQNQLHTDVLNTILSNARGIRGTMFATLKELLPDPAGQFTTGERKVIGGQLARMVKAGHVPELVWHGRNNENHQEYIVVTARPQPAA